MFKFLPALAFLLLSPSIIANQNIRLEQLSLEDGLSQGQVSQLLQDNDGFLWLGTQQGLNVYDGHRVSIISGPDHLLEIQQIDSIFQDDQNNIWIGSVPNRNFKISKNDGVITEINPPFPEGREVQDSAILEMAKGSQDNIWMTSMRALFSYNNKTEKLSWIIDFEPTIDEQNFIRAIYQFEENLLVASSNGLFAVNIQSPEIVKIPFEAELSPFEAPADSTEQDDRLNVKGIFQNQNDNILIATVEGLYEIDAYSLRSFLAQQSSKLELKTLDPQLNVWNLIEEDDFYWLATHEGLVKLTKNGEKQHILAYSNTPFQSVDDNIVDMIKDNEGNLWLGSRNDGAFKWTPDKKSINYFQKNKTGIRSLSHNLVWKNKEDHQGNIWVGTKNGLNKIDRQTGEIRQFLVNNDIKANVSASTIYDIEVQGDDLWLLSFSGVRKFNTTTQTETPLNLSKQAKEIFDKPLSDIFFIDSENMAVINEKGLYNYNINTGEISFNENTESNGKLTAQLFSMVGQSPTDPDKVYMTMVDQVVSYSKSTGRHEVLHALPPSDKPRTYAQDVFNDGKNTWISYPGFGIYIIDNQTGEEVRHISSLDGLPDNSQFDFNLDKNGNIWVTSNSGLIRFDKETFHFRVYDTNDGLSTNEFNGGASLITKSGDFYFGSIKGVMKIKPQELLPANNAKKLKNHITKLSLMSKELPTFFRPIKNYQLNLSHNDYGLKLSFSALSLTQPKKLKYKYWIEGSSKTKPTITSESELFLPKIEPGNSVFKVAVIDYETGKVSSPESLYLNVSPHPAFSWWAYSLYLLFLISVGSIIYWQRRKRQLLLIESNKVLKTSEERLQLALTGSDSGLWDWQADNDFVYDPRQEINATDNTTDNNQYNPFYMRVMSIHDDERQRYLKSWTQFISGKEQVFEFIYRMKTESGEWRWYKDLARVTESDKMNKPKRVTGTFIDITKSKDDRDKINLFSEAFQSTRDIVIIVDSHFKVSAANEALYRTTSFVSKKVIGHSLEFLTEPEKNTSLIDNIIEPLKASGHWEGEGLLQRLYQIPLQVLITVNQFTNEIGETRYVFAVTDIAKQKQAEEKLRKLANYDPLTGLPNRALLMDRVTHAIESARRNNKKMALFFIDLDRFKQINDTLGHDIGDQLLTNVAKILKFCTRRNDTVARLGGDEFVVMLEGLNNIEAVSRIARSILKQMQKPFQLSQHEVSVSSSIGISLYPNDGENSDELVKHADIAMYHAKNNGRNNFQFFTAEMNAFAHERLTLENQLRTAIRNKEFILHYQPKVSLLEQKIEGFELLVRWKKSDGTLVPPNDFIPVAEELGLIIEMTEQLIVEAMETMKDWIDKGITTSFALNLSARHLRQYDLTQFVASKLDALAIPASSIQFELTESTIMKDTESAVKLLNNLNQQGISISLDDFGTGYTSFQYLKEFPVDALKIDRSFVNGIGKDTKDEAIIESIITLASKLGILTIAEGVETQAQAEYLIEHQCPIAQGYLYSRPVPVEQALLLAKTGVLTEIKTV